MNTTELLKELSKHLEAKYLKTGIVFDEQVDGVLSSAISFVINCEGTAKKFRLGLTELQKQFGQE